MWDQRYDEEGFAYGTEPNEFLKSEYFQIPKDGQALCLEEGEGKKCCFLAKQVYLDTAIERSQYRTYDH